METLRKPLILIVDDTPKNIQVLGKTLHDTGYNVSFATSGKQGLDSRKKEIPDLILLDIQMPEMDGFEVCKILKVKPETKDIPVIFLTALTDSDKIVQGFEIGAVDYITKPFHTAELTIIINTSSKSAASLLENLLEWARSQTGEISIKPKNISINNLFSKTIQIVSAMAIKKNITIEMQQMNDEIVYADKLLVNTILRNLLTNAIKFTYSGGKVVLSTEKKKEFLEISVSDTGVGIEPGNIDKIFKIDSKFSNLGTEKEKGTGLGLILCKEFVEKQGGTIWVESKLEKGSKFTFRLPLGKNDTFYGEKL